MIAGVVVALVVIGGLWFLFGRGKDSIITLLIGQSEAPVPTFSFKTVVPKYEALATNLDKKKLEKAAKHAAPTIQHVTTQFLQAGYVDPDGWGDAGSINDFFTDDAKQQVDANIDTLTLGKNASDTVDTFTPAKKGTRHQGDVADRQQPERHPRQRRVHVQGHDRQHRRNHVEGHRHRHAVPGARRQRLEDRSVPHRPGRETPQGIVGLRVGVGSHVMTKKLLAVVLGLSAWIGGTVAATIGNGTAAQASPLFVLQQAHADYTPSLDGNTPLFILLLGSDSRPGVTPMNRGRSDSIHILGINPAAHRATVFGIPRDSYVPLSTGGTDKINAAMPIGGPEAEVQTVENVTGIKFDYYVLTGFQQVTQAVNQIGGLEVNVPYSVVGYQQTFPSGLHRMTGQEVLGYSRTRHSLPLGDFDRSLNQGVVLTSALTQFRNEYAKDPTRLV